MATILFYSHRPGVIILEGMNEKVNMLKCYTSASEYHLKYGFKYILEYCQIECNP
jgi:hypothetical protein